MNEVVSSKKKDIIKEGFYNLHWDLFLLGFIFGSIVSHKRNTWYGHKRIEIFSVDLLFLAELFGWFIFLFLLIGEKKKKDELYKGSIKKNI